MDESESRSELVLELAEEFLGRYRRGERPSLKEYADRHPELASEIRNVFPAMAMMENIAVVDESSEEATMGDAAKPAAFSLRQLGDYRIIREIGRGGMGYVFEAEQVSLGRHVALKLLPNHALHDDKQKRRFAREAKAAAKLHHTNIVPVFGVGEHDGVPYYVMQFIQGLGLDAVLEELRRLQPTDAPAPTALGAAGEIRVARRDVSAADMARSLITGTFDETADVGESPDRKATPVLEATLDLPVDDAVTTNGALPDVSDPSRLSDSFTISSSSVSLPDSSSAGRSGKKKQSYWHSVASIGRQVADALEYAHKQGIQHRDVKPSNLLLDLRGTVWVTDFGLAKVAGPDTDDLTHTGDILGTLRYMPPERFEGKSDARSDVYSLGLTLYELLAMRPAFVERDRNKLVKLMTTGEPPRLDKVRKGIPRDLVTIVQKAIERDPHRRYATAEDFAADLQRFLDDEPIQARRQTELERCVRWARHHPGIASLGGVLAGVLVLVTAASLLAAGYFNQVRLNESLAAQKERDARREATIARNGAARQAASLVLDRAIEDARNGEPSRALHLFVRALRTLPSDDPESPALERVIRQNLSSWAETAPALESIWPNGIFHTDMAFSSNGERIVLAVAEDTIQAFRTAVNRPLGPPAKLPGMVGEAMVFAADGRSVWVASPHRRTPQASKFSIHRLDVETGKPLQPPIPTSGPVIKLALSPDGERLVGSVLGYHPDDRGPAADAGGTRHWRLASIVVWKTANGDVVRKVDVNADLHLAFVGISRDGKSVSAWFPRESNVNEGITFNLDGKEPPVSLGRYPAKARTPWAVNFQNDRSTSLVIEDDEIHRWSSANPSVLGRASPAPFRSMYPEPSPDGRTVISLEDGRAFDVGAWPPRRSGSRFAHPGWLQEIWVESRGMDCRSSERFSSDGRFLATWTTFPSGHDRRLWRLPRPSSRSAPLPTEAGRASSQRDFFQFARFDPNGKTAVLWWLQQTKQTHNVRVVDVASGAERETPVRHLSAVRHVVFSKDGRYFATCSNDTTAQVFETSTGRPAGPQLVHRNFVAAVSFSPDGKTLAAGDYGPEGQIKLWDWRNGREVRPPLVHDDIVIDVLFSPDGKYLAALKAPDWSNHPEMLVWETESGGIAFRTRHHYATHRFRETLSVVGASNLQFRPDGRAVAALDLSDGLRLWEVPSGKLLGERRLDGASVTRFSPDGRIVAASAKLGVRLLDADTLAPLPHGLLPNAAAIQDIAFSPDGASLLASDDNGSAQLWDVASRKPVGPPAALIGPVRAVSFAPDGKTCLCVAADGSIRHWPVPTAISESDLDRLADRVALMTGQRMDEGHGLDFVAIDEWRSLRERLVGDGSTALAPPRSDAEWHDSTAVDAAQDGDVFGAVWHLDRLAALRPTDWTIPARLGRVLAASGRRDEAGAAYDKAARLASSPKWVSDWLRVCATDDEATGKKEAARWNLDRAITLTPNDWTLYFLRAGLADPARAAADFEEAIRRGAEPNVVFQAANAAASAGDWKRTAKLLTSLASGPNIPNQIRYIQAVACLKAGDSSGYKQACERLAKQLPPIGPKLSPPDANNAASVFALSPDATNDWTKPLALVDHALAQLQQFMKANPDKEQLGRQQQHIFLNTRGSLLYRAGRYQEAAKTLREGMSLDAGGGVFHDWFFLALAEHRLGRAGAAKEAAAKARAIAGSERASHWEKAEVETLSAELDAVLPRAAK